jgi:hypothetical protein
LHDSTAFSLFPLIGGLFHQVSLIELELEESMLRRFRSASAIALIALAVPALALAAGGKTYTPSKASLPSESGSPIAPLATVLANGWEAPAFVLGPVEPQNGYTASNVNNAWASVSALNPAVGAQHLRLVRDPSVAAGSLRIVFSPQVVIPANSPSQVKQMVYISNDGGADHDCFAQAPSQGFLTWRVKFSFADASGAGSGTIFILDDIGFGLEFVDTGILWTPAVYKELKVQFDPGLGAIRYFYDGVQIYTGGLVAGTAVEQIGWLHDSFQLAGEHAGIDAVDWIDTASDPTPTSTTTWGRIKSDYR